jgi:dolichol-phosphate mannosyltransferase
MQRTLSVIIPALNEAGNLSGTVATVQAAIAGRFEDYEILIFDDGSTDGTGPLADTLAAADPHIRVTHNGRNRGFGYNYCRGLELARMQYVALVTGDNEVQRDSIIAIFALVGRADIVAPYQADSLVRPLYRRALSSGYTWFMNLLFGLDLKYFNGPAVHRTELARSVPITTFGFAFLSEIMVRLVRSGCSYVEVAMEPRPRDYGRSKAVSLKNALTVVKTVGLLLWDVYWRERRRYAFRGKRLAASGDRVA